MGTYKNGKPNKEISIEQFKLYLDKGFFAKFSHKVYFVILFWIGCRRAEPLNIIKEDLIETEGSLYLKIPAFKHGARGGKIELSLELPGIIYLQTHWQNTRSSRRLFPFTSKTSWRIVKRLDPKISPHFFRHNRITKLRELKDKGILSTDDIKSWTGLKLSLIHI